MAKEYKIGLALSGGGVLGAAHIGAIEEMEKAGIKINYISGTSAGSIIGGIYASGGMNALNRFYDELKSRSGFSPKSRLQISGPTKFFRELKQILDDYIAPSFDEFKIPFSAIATDIESGDHKLLDQGDPVACIMASCAYPGVFPIQRISQTYLIDGGVTLNLPAEEVAERCSFVIGSNIYSIGEIKKGRAPGLNRAASITRSLEIMERRLSAYQEKYCDFCFRPESKNLKWYHFWRMEEIRDLGREYAQKEIDKLKEKVLT